jgi:ATP-dependent Clp protease ATP-binding subunit ClpB
MKQAVMEIVRSHFRPEFINRVDDVVVFHPLGREQLRRITEVQVQFLRNRLRDRDLDLELTPKALDHIAAAGFDPVYGARPLRRSIQNQIENPLAEEILAGRFGPRDVIVADLAGSEIVFRKKTGPSVSSGRTGAGQRG